MEIEADTLPYILPQLIAQINYTWPQMSEHLPQLEQAYEQSPNKDLAYLISKIYYNLNSLKLALNYYLKSGGSGKTDLFESTLVNAVIDEYLAGNRSPQIVAILDGMMTVGIAVESERVDYLKTKLDSHLCEYLLKVSAKKSIVQLVQAFYVGKSDFCWNLLKTYLLLNQEPQLDKFDQQLVLDYIKVKHDPKLKSFRKKQLKAEREFLLRQQNTDKLILKQINASIEQRASVNHQAVSICNALQNLGTGNDLFLRENMEWLGRAANWTKFTACAQLGVIHSGNFDNGRVLLGPYLPTDTVSSSVYSEGGALYALGLLNAGTYSIEDVQYLKTYLGSQDETIAHGAALGTGLISLSTKDKELFEQLKNILYQDQAVAGEAVGLAMGLIMSGSNDNAAAEAMIQYASQTQHDKIIRGLSLGSSFLAYGQQEQAEPLINKMLSNSEAALRYGAAYAVALAYAGTGNISVLKRLLHLAVSDVNDDVRRVAVIAIGFVLCKEPHKTAAVVSMLAESYNPSVRYGAAMALGVSCAGTADVGAMKILKVLVKDTTDFVRQGALIASAFVLQQHNDTNEHYKEFKKTLDAVLYAKHENLLARFGGIVAQGILDAGGRNVCLSLTKSIEGERFVSEVSCVGMVMFLQYWYWYPLTLGLSLCAEVTGVIGVIPQGDELKIVDSKDLLKSLHPPSKFAYPPMTTPPTAEKVEKVATAVLSTTHKAKAKADADMVIVSPAVESPKATVADEKPAAPAEEKKQPEKEDQLLPNLSRVVQGQHVVWNDARYKPTHKRTRGIVLLKDTKGGESKFIEYTQVQAPAASESGAAELPMPEPFEYTE